MVLYPKYVLQCGQSKNRGILLYNQNSKFNFDKSQVLVQHFYLIFSSYSDFVNYVSCCIHPSQYRIQSRVKYSAQCRVSFTSLNLGHFHCPFKEYIPTPFKKIEYSSFQVCLTLTQNSRETVPCDMSCLLEVVLENTISPFLLSFKSHLCVSTGRIQRGTILEKSSGKQSSRLSLHSTENVDRGGSTVEWHALLFYQDFQMERTARQ